MEHLTLGHPPDLAAMIPPSDPHAVADAIAALAVDWDRANGDEEFPRARLDALAARGALDAFRALPDPAAVDALDRSLRAVGAADLSLGRLWEGHVNAVQLIEVYGGDDQRGRLADDLAAARLYGVWNTEPPPGMTIAPTGDGRWRLSGSKIFATGAGYIDRALITVRRSDGAKQMVIVDVSVDRGRADNDGWRVRGMKGTASGAYDFDGLEVEDAALIGVPGDYEREPRFSAGAWRFAAVQLGAAEALVRHVRAHLVAARKDGDPHQRVRFAACLVAVRGAGVWVRRAAHLAEQASPDAVAFVLMTRGVVEEAALAVMEAAARGVGTASFFEGSRIDRITRDLGLYLRQPAPDQARERAAAAWIEADRWNDDPWW